MKDTIVLVDPIADQTLHYYYLELIDQGCHPNVVNVGRNYFSTRFDNIMEQYISDQKAILRRNGLSDGMAGDSNERPHFSIYDLVAMEIKFDFPNLNFSKIDKVLYSIEDPSWVAEELCLVFFGHASCYDLVLGL